MFHLVTTFRTLTTQLKLQDLDMHPFPSPVLHPDAICTFKGWHCCCLPCHFRYPVYKGVIEYKKTVARTHTHGLLGLHKSLPWDTVAAKRENKFNSTEIIPMSIIRYSDQGTCIPSISEVLVNDKTEARCEYQRTECVLTPLVLFYASYVPSGAQVTKFADCQIKKGTSCILN